MGATYTYLLADTRDGVILDDLPLVGVSFSMELGEPGTLRARLPVSEDPRRAQWQRRITEPARNVIYVDRDGVLVWGGIVWTTKYDPGSRMLEIGAADFLSYLEHRIVRRPEPSEDPVEFTGTPIGIAAELLGLSAEPEAGDIGLRVITRGDGGPESTVVYEYADMKPLDAAIADLAEAEGGFEIASGIAYDPEGRPERRILLGHPRLGQPGAPLVWEIGANMTEIVWPRDGSAVATRVYVAGARGDDGAAPIGIDEDESAYEGGWPMLESHASYSDIAEQGALDRIAESELAARRRPIMLPEPVVRGDVAPVLGSYAVGDEARIVVDDPFLGDGHGFDGVVRIVGIDVAPGDDADEEAVKLTVSPVV